MLFESGPRIRPGAISQVSGASWRMSAEMPSDAWGDAAGGFSAVWTSPATAAVGIGVLSGAVAGAGIPQSIDD